MEKEKQLNLTIANQTYFNFFQQERPKCSHGKSKMATNDNEENGVPIKNELGRVLATKHFQLLLKAFSRTLHHYMKKLPN